LVKFPGIGIPKPEEVLPPIIKRNYGKWVSHEFGKAGILKHISETGEECITIRIGMPTNGRVSTDTLNKICDLADEYADGYFRVTTRNHVEFVGVKEDKIDSLISKLGNIGLPVGGTGRRFHQTTCCTGWLHCQLAATDSPSVAKAISDNFYDEFISEKEPFPAKLKISVAGCLNQCGEGSTADIGAVGVYREAPRVKDEAVKACEISTTIRVCPVGAIRPKGKETILINPDRCIYCGYCMMTCEAITMVPETAGLAIVVGGKAGNTGDGPAWAKVAVHYLPNNPPGWEETVEVIRRIVDVWKNDAQKDERIREWINRIGWEKFFEKTSIEVNLKHIDGLLGGTRNVRSNVRFRW
jgi:sulfite reductase beta subunit|tara:strand:+ start:2889 stop:3953 length:1065 start_codon:yes stop_codon:yes gene_type:complete